MDSVRQNTAHKIPHRSDLFASARLLKVPVWIFDVDNNRIVYANQSACTLWQASDEAELRGRDMSVGMSASVARRLRQYQADFAESDASFTEMWTLYPGGVATHLMVHYRGIGLPDGRIAMQCEVLGAADDQPDNIRSAEALLHTDVMVSLFTLSGVPLYMNPAARQVAGHGDASLSSLFVKRQDYDCFMFDLDGSQELRQVVRVNTVDGGRWFDISAKLCSDGVTGDPAVLLTSIDVSELKDARDQAHYLANRDQLTGCYNRAYLQHYQLPKPRPDAPLAAVMYFDIDRFKQINDTFGHSVGDLVLQELSKQARALIRAGDMLVRLGGDEFIVILPHIENTETLKGRVQDFFAALGQPVTHGTSSITVHVSMGATIVSDGTPDLEAALGQADIALYASKKNGRNRCTFFDPDMGCAAEKRRRTEVEIEKAIEARQFVLHYQPRIDMQTGQVASLEGLVRWMHPQRGIIGPPDFIPICEETGMIDQLGQQVLDMGFAQALRLSRDGSNVSISLNVSPRQFSNDHLYDALCRFARCPGFVPGQVELEITETVLFGNPKVIARKLRRITDLGFEIAIDDFGTGYSNLSYISHFPLHSLKIDQSFVAQLPESEPIMKLIISLAQQIGARTVAEGVETREQFELLAEYGCDQVQGFYIARPMPFDNLGPLDEVILP